MSKLFRFFMCMLCIPMAYAQNIQHAEMLSRPTDKSVTVQMFFDADVEMGIEYGLSKGTYTSQVPFAKFLKGKQPNLKLQDFNPIHAIFIG